MKFKKQIFWEDIKLMPKLFVGLIFVSLGLFFSKLSGLGMLPWGVFHTGISYISGNTITFGQAVQLVGLIILVLSVIFVKIEPGIGTIMNLIFVGWMVDLFDLANEHLNWFTKFYQTNLKGMSYFDTFKQSLDIFHNPHLLQQTLYMILGLVIGSFGTALYISCKLGAGPRDGLFVGVTQMTGLSVKYSKPMIEITAVILGFLMKGAFGWGTIVNALVSGYVVHTYFKLIKFDPKSKKHRSLRAYFSKKIKLEE